MVGVADHLGLNVSDLDDSIEFYCGLLGMEVDRRFPASDEQADIIGLPETEAEIAFLDANGFTIELISYAVPDSENIHESVGDHDVGVAHFCLTVDDIAGEYERLSEVGVEFIHDPIELDSGLQIAYMYDPDGTVVELSEKP